MIALLQRVSHANVKVDNKLIAEIKRGLLVFIGVEKGDDEARTNRLIERFLGYRVFADQDGKMNLSVTDIEGDVLLVPQFTLAADTRKGARPSFSSAASPERGKELFHYVVRQAQQQYPQVCAGEFGADMQVNLLNDGPVTFWLQS